MTTAEIDPMTKLSLRECKDRMRRYAATKSAEDVRAALQLAESGRMEYVDDRVKEKESATHKGERTA